MMERLEFKLDQWLVGRRSPKRFVTRFHQHEFWAVGPPGREFADIQCKNCAACITDEEIRLKRAGFPVGW